MQETVSSVIEFIDRGQVRRLTGLSDSAVYRGVHAKTFPAPVRTGPRSAKWILSEVVGWRDARIAERDSGKH